MPSVNELKLVFVQTLPNVLSLSPSECLECSIMLTELLDKVQKYFNTHEIIKLFIFIIFSKEQAQ